MTAIRAENLTKIYPIIKGYRELILHPFRKTGVTALAGVNLEVDSGRCFCLMGPNGAGKTTLIKIFSTLVLPDSGRAFVNGFDVSKSPKEVKNSIGYALGEERSFYWRLTGRQNLEFFAALNGISWRERRDKIEEVLKLTGLKEAADLRFNTYSTGMRQMMSFARALLAEPKILFVDEPTRSLDPKSALKIRKFIREEMVDRQGRTVFWATHNLAEAQEFGHDLAIIDKGQVKTSGSVSTLTNNGEIPLQDLYDRSVSSDE